MRKLTKANLAERDKLASDLRDRATDLDAAIGKYNDAISRAWEELEAHQMAYNEAVADANAWKTEIASDIQNYMDDRSEKWHEGDVASQYESWKEQFEQEELDQVDFAQPEQIEADLADAAELLDQLPEEVDL
jgi:hypothetical protein